MKIPQLHIPDGFINAPVSILFLAISAFFVFLALRGAKNQLDEKVAPLARASTRAPRRGVRRTARVISPTP